MNDLKLVLQRVFPQVPWKFFREHAFYKLSIGDRDADLSFEIVLEQDFYTGAVTYLPRFNDTWGPKQSAEAAAEWLRTRLDVYCTQRAKLLKQEMAALKALSK
jgi:hypothetical protein